LKKEKRKAIKTMNITTSFDVLQAVIFFQHLLYLLNYYFSGLCPKLNREDECLPLLLLVTSNKKTLGFEKHLQLFFTNR
jgi:hypothetical protein